MKYVGIFFFVLLSALSAPQIAVARDYLDVDNEPIGYALLDFDKKATYVQIFRLPKTVKVRGREGTTTWKNAESLCGEKFDGVGKWRMLTFSEAKAVAQHYSSSSDQRIWINEPATYYYSTDDSRISGQDANYTTTVYCVHSPYTSERLSELRGESKKPAEKPTVTKNSEKPLAPILTKSGPLKKTPEEIQEQKNKDAKHAQEVVEQKRLQAEKVAAGKAAAKASDDKARQFCMVPANRGDCGCLKYYPNAKGDVCGK